MSDSLEPVLDELKREAQQRSRDALLDWVIKVLFPIAVVGTAAGGLVGGTAGYLAGRDASEGGALEVTSKPSPARVTLDGRIVGKTPIERLEVDPGTHAVVVESLGYEPFLDNVKVKDGATAKVHAVLAKATPTPKQKQSEVSYVPRAAPMPTRDCSAEQYRCERGCDDAESSCWMSCPYCGSCNTSMTSQQCQAMCDQCRAGCKQNEEFCMSGCRTNYDICSR